MAEAGLFALGAPSSVETWSATPTSTLVTCDASDKGLAYIVSPPEPCTITKIRFLYGVRTGTPPTYRIALESLDASGLPSGTVLGGGSPASVTFTPPADTTWNGLVQEVTLANSYIATRGEVFAVTVRHSSGTVDGSNNGSFVEFWSYRSSASAFPYCANLLGGVWGLISRYPNVGLVTASKTIGDVVQTVTTTNFEDDLSPDQYGLVWTIPEGLFPQYKVAGVRWNGRSTNASAGTFTLKLYDTDGTTVLQDITRNLIDQGLGSTNNGRVWVVYFDEATLATLIAGRQYRIGLRTSDTTGTPVSLPRVRFATTQDALGPTGGKTFGLCTNTDDGAWTDEFKDRPMMDLLIEAVESPLVVSVAHSQVVAPFRAVGY